MLSPALTTGIQAHSSQFAPLMMRGRSTNQGGQHRRRSDVNILPSPGGLGHIGFMGFIGAIGFIGSMGFISP